MIGRKTTGCAGAVMSIQIRRVGEASGVAVVHHANVNCGIEGRGSGGGGGQVGRFDTAIGGQSVPLAEAGRLLGL